MSDSTSSCRVIRGRGWPSTGEVLVASGRYLQDFTVRNAVISPNINESAVRPFYDGVPLLEEPGPRSAGAHRGRQLHGAEQPRPRAARDLRSAGPRHARPSPCIAGEVRPTDGRFHIFGVRGDFTLVPNVNHITFVDTKSIDRGETPELNLEAEAIVVDSTSREHVVRMRISGPISQAEIDLSSNTGLDRNQAMLLLLSGRTSEQETVLRRHAQSLPWAPTCARGPT